MTSMKTLLPFSILFVGCTVENNLKDMVPSTLGGECDPNIPIEAPENAQPVAVCTATDNLVPPIRSSVDFLGEESYDPNGLDLVNHYWKLVEQPQGSTVTGGGNNVNEMGFVPDVVGRYVFELVVVNEACVHSDPCQVALEAVPDADLWIEMFWQFPGDDMDLHLIQNEAQYLSEGDCYYGNCVSYDGDSTLDWGGAGSEDDPHLDLDDIEGIGPENINIQSPASGQYRVVVHDYPGSERWEANAVTVRIYVGSEMVYEESKSIEGEDIYVPFANINWPSGEVTPL